jgi:hypothetical protein
VQNEKPHIDLLRTDPLAEKLTNFEDAVAQEDTAVDLEHTN